MMPFALMALAGCAANPKDIPPAYTGTAQYEAMDCAGLTTQIVAVESQLDSAIRRQAHAVNTNVSMSVMFGVLGAAATQSKGTEAEVARLKGERLAIRDAAARKSCTLPPSNEVVAGFA